VRGLLDFIDAIAVLFRGVCSMDGCNGAAIEGDIMLLGKGEEEADIA
jgi:hypothetical protein